MTAFFSISPWKTVKRNTCLYSAGVFWKASKLTSEICKIFKNHATQTFLMPLCFLLTACFLVPQDVFLNACFLPLLLQSMDYLDVLFHNNLAFFSCSFSLSKNIPKFVRCIKSFINFGSNDNLKNYVSKFTSLFGSEIKIKFRAVLSASVKMWNISTFSIKYFLYMSATTFFGKKRFQKDLDETFKWKFSKYQKLAWHKSSGDFDFFF